MQYRVLTNKTVLFIILLFLTCCNRKEEIIGIHSSNKNFLSKLTEIEIKKFVLSKCTFQKVYGVNKNSCFYNDLGFVNKIDYFRFDICEEMIFNKPHSCITEEVYFSYFETEFVECHFVWNYRTEEYDFTECYTYQNKIFENIAKNKSLELLVEN